MKEDSATKHTQEEELKRRKAQKVDTEGQDLRRTLELFMTVETMHDREKTA